MSMRTSVCYRNVDWLVRWNAKAGAHEYLRGGDFAYEGDASCMPGTALPAPVPRSVTAPA